MRAIYLPGLHFLARLYKNNLCKIKESCHVCNLSQSQIEPRWASVLGDLLLTRDKEPAGYCCNSMLVLKISAKFSSRDKKFSCSVFPKTDMIQCCDSWSESSDNRCDNGCAGPEGPYHKVSFIVHCIIHVVLSHASSNLLTVSYSWSIKFMEVGS